MAHTPGPWRVGSYGPNGCYTIGTQQGLMVAHSVHIPNQKEQAIDDAHLIAAAPELLEVLEETLDYWIPDQGLLAVEQEMRNKVIAAIKKAKGETT